MSDREQIWRERLMLFAESGLTQRAFCDRHGLSAKAMRLWARRLGFLWPPHKVVPPVGASGKRAKEFSGSPEKDLAIPVGGLENLLAIRLRKTWTSEERLALLGEALQSGMSLDAYAKMNGLAPSVLYRWRKQFADQLAECPTDPLARQPKFASVTLAEGSTMPQLPPSKQSSADRLEMRTPMSAPVEILLRNGRILRVGDPIDFSVIARLADALEASA